MLIELRLDDQRRFAKTCIRLITAPGLNASFNVSLGRIELEMAVFTNAPSAAMSRCTQ